MKKNVIKLVTFSVILLFLFTAGTTALASGNWWYDYYIDQENIWGDYAVDTHETYYNSDRQRSTQVLVWSGSHTWQSFLNLYEYTKNTDWLDQCVSDFDTIIANAYDYRNDGYDCWYNEGTDDLVWDGKITAPIAQFVSLVYNTPHLYANATYRQKANSYRDFLEDNIIERWQNPNSYDGDCWRDFSSTEGTYYYPDSRNFAVRWNFAFSFGEMLLYMYDATGNSDYLDKVTKMSNYFRNNHLHTQTENDQSCYSWTFHVEGTTGTRYEDMDHGQFDMGMIYQMFRHGLVYSGTDMERFTNTFTELLWRGTYNNSGDMFYDLVNGTNYSSGRQKWEYAVSNWAELAQFDPRVWRIAGSRLENLYDIDWDKPRDLLAISQQIKWDPERLTNRGFEYWSSSDDSLPARWNRTNGTSTSNVYLDSDNSKEGKYGLTVKSNGTSNQRLYQTWNEWSGNTTYYIEFDCKTNGSSAGGQVFIRNLDASQTLATQNFTDTSWTHYSVSFTSPSDTSDDVVLYLGNQDYTVNGGEAYFDNVTIRRYNDPTPCPYTDVTPTPAGTATPTPTTDPNAWYSKTDYSEVHSLGTANTGSITVEFDITPFDYNGGVVGYADTDTTIDAYGDMNMIVAVESEGYFAARNGDTYSKDANVYYNTDEQYHVRLVTDLSAATQSYDVYVTAPLSEEVQIANEYSYRTGSPSIDDLGKVILKAASTASNGNFKVNNHEIVEPVSSPTAAPTGTPTPTATATCTPTPTATPTATPTPPTPEPTPTPDTSAWYSESDYSEVHSLGSSNTDVVTIEFNVTPLTVDVPGAVGYADTSTTIDELRDMAILIGLGDDGYFYAWDYSGYAAYQILQYQTDTEYSVKIVTDVSMGVYDAFITPSGGSSTQIANEFEYRDTATMDDVGQVLLKHSTINSSSTFFVKSHTIASATPTPAVSPTATPSATCTPTATPTATPTPTPDPDIWYAKTDFSEVHSLGTSNTGTVTIDFDLTPLYDVVSGTVGYTDSSITIDEYSDMAMFISLSSSGYFNVRNGTEYTNDNVVYYSKDTAYSFRVVANLDSATYDVYVTTSGGSKTQIANDYAFRSDAPAIDDVGKVNIKSTVDSGNYSYKVENHTVLSSTPTPTPSSVWYSKGDFSEVHSLGDGNTGIVTAEFDLTPFASPIIGAVGYADTNTYIDAMNDMAMLIYADDTGYFTVRNGSSYTNDATVNYSADTKYSFKMIVDFTNCTYDVYVTPSGGSETKIADDYAFRSDAPYTDDLGKVNIKNAVTYNDGCFKVENHSVVNATPTPTPTQSPTPTATPAATSTPTPGGLPYSENFDDGTADDWSTTGGSWSVSSGVYDQSSTSDTYVSYYDYGSSWTDFEYSAEVEAPSAGGTGIAFRVGDSGNDFYLFRFRQASEDLLKVYRYDDGSSNYLATYSHTVTAGNMYTLKVEADGGSLTFYVDGTEKGTVTDNTYSSGSVGLCTVNTTGDFDDVSVTLLNGATATPEATPTATPSNTATPTPNVTNTPAPTNTPTATPTPTVTPTPGGLPYSEDFSDSLSDWSTTGGSWSVSSGEYSQSSTSDTYVSYYDYGSSWTDYTYSAEVEAPSAGGTGIAFRVGDNGDDFYLFRFRKASENLVKVYRYDNGSSTYLATYSHTVTAGNMYTLKVEADGSSLTFYVDGTEKGTVTDNTYSSGTVGLCTVNTTGDFDDVSVTSQ